MGYTTEFKGRFEFDRPVDPDLANFLNKFAEYRHVTRNVELYKKSRPDWESRCFNGDPGKDGEYIADESVFPPMAEVNRNLDALGVKDYNTPPGNCPGLWCQWVVTEDNKYLEWDGAEKFYKYVEWLDYLISNFIGPSGYVLNGAVEYQGEYRDDYGVIYVKDNDVTHQPYDRLDLDEKSEKDG